MSTIKTGQTVSIKQLNYGIFHMNMNIHVNKLHHSFPIISLQVEIEKTHVFVGEYGDDNIQNDQ